MKKFALIMLAVLVLAFAAPAFSATRAFLDVDEDHWAYAAIQQLAAKRIMVGLPDGFFYGKEKASRFELASALANALHDVDLTHATKQDVEMMKELVLHFSDEMDALGLRVDDLDEKVSVFEDRLGGWKISGNFYVDILNRSANTGNKDDSNVDLHEARLIFTRTFGEGDSMKFTARLRHDIGDERARLDRFFVDMPFFWDTTLTVGRFCWEFEDDYYVSGNSLASIKNEGGFFKGDDVLTDVRIDGFGLTKNFGLGKFRAYVSHTNKGNGTDETTFKGKDINGETIAVDEISVWELAMAANLQFTESIGLDIGGQVFLADNDEYYEGTKWNNGGTEMDGFKGYAFNNLWTIFAGLRFNWNENIALKGIFYHQQWDIEKPWPKAEDDVNSNNWGWKDLLNEDDANHWAVMIDISQAALKFSSLWLEYGQYDKYFFSPCGLNGYNGGSLFGTNSTVLPSSIDDDVKYWRVALGQEWNDSWATHLFYYGYDFGNMFGDNADKGMEVGVGVRYRLNPSTTMGLNYVHVDNGGDGNNTEDNLVRFRTKVSF